MAARSPITAPPATPPRYSLIVAARDAGLDPDALFHGWKFDPEPCGSALGGRLAREVYLGSSNALTEVANTTRVDGDPFLIYHGEQRSAMNVGRDWEARARRGLAAVESHELAEELWTGSLGLAQRSLTDSDAALTTVTTGPTTAALVMSLLEGSMGDKLAGQRGMIHCAPEALALFAAAGVVRWDTGGLWLSPAGHIVVCDSGYTGSAPTNAAAAAGSSWVYGTSLIAVGLGEVQITGLGADGVDRTVNDRTVWAARLATWVWDGCGHVAAELDLTAEPGAGGGAVSLAAPTVTRTRANADSGAGGLTSDYLYGWFVRETSGSAAAVVNIRFGDDATDVPFIPINLAAGESVSFYTVPGIPTGGTVFFDVVSGAVDGVIVHGD